MLSETPTLLGETLILLDEVLALFGETLTRFHESLDFGSPREHRRGNWLRKRGLARERNRVELIAGPARHRLPKLNGRERFVAFERMRIVIQDRGGDPVSLPEKTNMLEMSLESLVELIRDELIAMVRIAGNVDVAVWRRDCEHTVACQNPCELSEDSLRVLDVLDHFKANDDIERMVVKG